MLDRSIARCSLGNKWRSYRLDTPQGECRLLSAAGYESRGLPIQKTQNSVLVAILQKDASSPAFLLTVDVENRIMTVRPVAARYEPGKSYELWLVQDSLGAPKSLGVIDDPHVRSTLAAYKPEVIKSATFAVSLEPEGG